MPSNHSIGADALPDESEDSDYLRDNLLDETEPVTVVDTNPFRQQNVPARQESIRRETVGSARRETVSSARLVIAIDYGTTFTGKQTFAAIVCI
jgi:hypothetical protein